MTSGAGTSVADTGLGVYAHLVFWRACWGGGGTMAAPPSSPPRPPLLPQRSCSPHPNGNLHPRWSSAGACWHHDPFPEPKKRMLINCVFQLDFTNAANKQLVSWTTTSSNMMLKPRAFFPPFCAAKWRFEVTASNKRSPWTDRVSAYCYMTLHFRWTPTHTMNSRSYQSPLRF